MLVILVLMGLVTASAVVAVIAADWPFWQRAWRWHVAGEAGPEYIPGSWRWVGRGAGAAWDVPASDDWAWHRMLQQVPTRALVASQDGRLTVEHFGAGVTTDDLLQGGALTSAILAPLYGAADQRGAGLLDVPLRRLLPELRDEVRGDITPRQLLWQVSGLESPAWRPLDPFSARARLSAGPNFSRAALAFRDIFPPGSHFETSPGNAQLAAMALVAAEGKPLAELLAERLWIPLGAGRARVMLDRLGGDMAAHCCLAATARDWLRLARLYAEDGVVTGRQLVPQGFILHEVARATAVHPAYGLGVEIETLSDGTRLLWSGAGDRLMLAVPGRKIAAVWFANQPLGAAEREALKAALGLGGPRDNP